MRKAKILAAGLVAAAVVRLVDIDAPELKQPFGKDSRASLRRLCLSKRAVVDTRGEDRYGRTLGQVTVLADANAEQVRRGMAWVFVRYARSDSPLYEAQAEARARRVGLWVDPEATAPREWRAQQR